MLMTRARNGRVAALRVLALLASGTLSATACSGPQKLGGPGAVCFRADDCQAGLACVPEPKGAAKRVCSADLSGIVAMVDGGLVEAAAPLGAGAPGAPGGGSPSSGGGAMAAAGLSASGSAGIPAGGFSAGGAAGFAAAASSNGGNAAAGAGG